MHDATQVCRRAMTAVRTEDFAALDRSVFPRGASSGPTGSCAATLALVVGCCCAALCRRLVLVLAVGNSGGVRLWRRRDGGAGNVIRRTISTQRPCGRCGT